MLTMVLEYLPLVPDIYPKNGHVDITNHPPVITIDSWYKMVCSPFPVMGGASGIVVFNQLIINHSQLPCCTIIYHHLPSFRSINHDGYKSSSTIRIWVSAVPDPLRPGVTGDEIDRAGSRSNSWALLKIPVELLIIGYLIGGLEHFVFFHILGRIILTD